MTPERDARMARRAMLALTAALIVAQVADLAWPRADERTASPASVLAAVCLAFLLALYPTGRFVPRWTAPAALLLCVLFAAAAIAGPDVSARFLWPLPIAPLLIALIIGGQGYRYMRRASTQERETARWPLLGLLLLLTVTLPADVLSVLSTGATFHASGGVDLLLRLAFLLPGLGALAGLLVPRTELVDRMLSWWVAFVIAVVVLASVFAIVFGVGRLWFPDPWPAWTGAAAVAAASPIVLSSGRRAGAKLVFRGRVHSHRAIALLQRRIKGTLDLGDVPVEVAQAIADSAGFRGVMLQRWGQQAPWAVAGVMGETGAPGTWQATVSHLGLPVAVLHVRARAGESALTSADRRLVADLADAAAPALHGARLASAFPELTDRERQVLAGIVRGLPNTAIAARLGVSGKTVANYVSIVLTKLRVPDKERAAELARRRGAEWGELTG